jgi:hypothetical protein
MELRADLGNLGRFSWQILIVCQGCSKRAAARSAPSGSASSADTQRILSQFYLSFESLAIYRTAQQYEQPV